MAVSDRLDRLQRRHPALGFPIAVLYKFVDDQGSYLSALIAYYGIVSLFPLLLLLATILGFVLQGDHHLQQQVVRSALTQFPAIGSQLKGDPESLSGSGVALVVGIAGSLYGGLGVAQAVQNALAKAWAVPRQQRPNPIKARLRSLAMLFVLGLGALLTTVLSGIATWAGHYGPWTRVFTLLLSVVGNTGVFLVTFKVLTPMRVSWRQIRLAAVTAAVGWQVVLVLGTRYVGHQLRGSSQVYGVFGFIIGALAVIYLQALVVVFAAEVNVVREKGLWPRALLTPFTDNVELTEPDRRAYTSYAQTERHKGFEEVQVTFDESRRDRAGTGAPPGDG